MEIDGIYNLRRGTTILSDHPSENDPDTSSGKDIAYENFPVGSFLLPAKTRSHVAVFYTFARTADDIADSPLLPAEEKIRRLEEYGNVLEGTGEPAERYLPAKRMRESLTNTGITSRHCLDLLSAFKQDATKLRYANWDDLIEYCMRSAAPVGRYLVDLHGGSASAYDASDALCIALQILNHLQDIKADYMDLDRVYIPQDWMTAHGVEISILGGSYTPPGLAEVIQKMLVSTRELIECAGPLPGALASRRLAMESQVILNIADRLSKSIRRGDPLAGRITLSKWQYMGSIATGIVQGYFNSLAPAR